MRQPQNTLERAVILSPGGSLCFDLAGSNATDPTRERIHAALKPTLLTRDELKGREREGIAALGGWYLIH